MHRADYIKDVSRWVHRTNYIKDISRFRSHFGSSRFGSRIFRLLPQLACGRRFTIQMGLRHMEIEVQKAKHNKMGKTQASNSSVDQTKLREYSARNDPASDEEVWPHAPAPGKLPIPAAFVESTPWSNSWFTNQRKGCIEVGLSKHNLDDAGMSHWCSWACTELPRLGAALQVDEDARTCRAKKGLILDFSENSIGDEGCISMVTLLTKQLRGVSIRMIRLHENRLGPGSATALGALMIELGAEEEDSRGVPEELHLSNNHIGDAGIRILLEAAARAGEGTATPAYPLPAARGDSWRKTRPLWLRVQSNGLPEGQVEHFLADVSADLAEIRYMTLTTS